MMSLMRMLSSPWAGFAAMVGVIVLGLALIATSITAGRTEAMLRGKIAALTNANRQSGVMWSAKLATCEAGGQSARGRVTAAALSDEARAHALAENAPAGFDVCARMESADQAVLETLKK